MKSNQKPKTKNQKRNILIINTAFERGGAAQIARTLYNGLEDNPEIISFFYFGRGKKAEDRNVIRNFFTFEFFLHFILVRFAGIEGIGSFFSTLALKLFIEKRKFDLIHIHNIHGYYLNFSFMEYIDSLNIPIIWTLHDVWPLTGRCAYFSDCGKWKNGCYDCDYKSNYPKTYIDRSASLFKKKKSLFSKLKNITIVTPSIWLQDIVDQSFLKCKKKKIIANGVDINLFRIMDKNNARKEFNIPLDADCIMYIASDIDDERKGFDYFLKSLSMIKHDKVNILTVGEISRKTKNRMDRFSCIHFGQVQDKNMLVSIYNAADIFVISSLDDNFPNTVLESLACGVPIVGFKTGGVPEQINAGCGIIVERGDAAGMASSITKMLNDKKKLDIMSKQCRLRCESIFSLDLMIENYKDLYLEMLNI